jgi:hypothetical protein
MTEHGNVNKIRLMSLIPRHFLTSSSGWAAGLTAAGLAGVAGLGIAWSANRLPAVPTVTASDSHVAAKTTLPRRSSRISLPLESWSVFRMDGEAIREVSNSLANRFRLAGTFRVIQPDSVAQKGVLCDLVRSNQSLIVSAGDELDDGIVVKDIGVDRLELVRQDVSIILTLDDQPGGSSTNPAAAGSGESADLFAGYPVLSRGQFGIQIEDKRWLFERRKVLEYYNDVLEDPDRLVALFDSLKPLYNEKKKIDGYILVQEGEKDFFKEVGLKEGDVIRKVNSVPLMNRRVAEGFIRDFGQDDLSVAVLEIERDGEPARLVYEVR